jgi:hypothetical protein
MITARLASEKDIDRIVEIRNTISGYFDFTPAFVQNRIESKNCIAAVVCDGDKLVGFSFDVLGAKEVDGVKINIVTHCVLDSKWSNLNPLNKLSAISELEKLFIKQTVFPNKTTITQFTIKTGTHSLVRNAIETTKWSTVGLDHNEDEIFERIN